MGRKVFLTMVGCAWICIVGSGPFLRPVFAASGEFEPDANTLFLAHYNTSLDADYSQGPAKHDSLDTAYLTKNGGYFGGGLVCRVGVEALKESGADIGTSTLIPPKSFDGVRYTAPGNIDLVKGTFECWYKPYFSIKWADDMPKDWPMLYMIFTYTETAVSSMGLGARTSLEAGKVGQREAITFGVARKDSYVPIDVAIDWKPGTWHHLAVTWDTAEPPGNTAFFIDGRLIRSQSLSQLKGGFPRQSSEYPYFCIGGQLWRGAGNPMQFNKADGIIDEVRISNIVRYSGDFKLSEKPQPAAAKQ